MTSRPDVADDVQLDRDVCKLVSRLAQTLDVHVRRVGEELGITPAQVIALRELTEPITARELANRMYCEPSNATFVLDRLEQQGLIDAGFGSSGSNREAKFYQPTPAARRQLTEGTRSWERLSGAAARVLAGS